MRGEPVVGKVEVVERLRGRCGRALELELDGRVTGREETRHGHRDDSDQSKRKKERDALTSAPAPGTSPRDPRLWDVGCDGGNPLVFSCAWRILANANHVRVCNQCPDFLELRETRHCERCVKPVGMKHEGAEATSSSTMKIGPGVSWFQFTQG
jgi:hypothetical protein